MNLDFKTALTPIRTSAETPVYRGVVIHNGSVGEEAFFDRVAKRCALDRSIVNSVNHAIIAQMADEIANGYRISLGQIYVSLAVQGRFKSLDDTWDSSRHRLVANVTAKGALKDSVKALTPVNVTVGPKVSISYAIDTVAKMDGIITGTSDVCVRMSGRGLAVDAAAEDEGVWLAAADGTVAARATVTEATATTLTCRFDSLPSDGSYSLVVASRNRMGADYGVAVGKKAVMVQAVYDTEGGEA